jgi:ATP-dependent RNA helicase SUPV3L1/SUV3
LRICGFETFGNFIIRVDILERLFIEIINRSKDYKFKLDSKILNLLGCTKDDFINFIKLIGYKVINEENEPEFKYLPKKIRKNKEKKATNAFSVLENYKI